MAKRKKLEPILLEDLENNPCASGLDKVLRFDVPVMPGLSTPGPGEETAAETSLETTPVQTTVVQTTQVSSIGVEFAKASTPVETNAVSTPVETTQVSTAIRAVADESTGVEILLPPPEARLALTRTKKRLYRPIRAEDAHTDGENRLYQFMWNAGSAHAEGVRVYAGSISTLARALGRDDRNTRPVLESLIRKLSIAIARDQDFHTGHPRIYFVFDAKEIQERRRRAGLEWAVKNKGIQLLTPDQAAGLAASDRASTPVNSYQDLTPVFTSNVSTAVK